MCKICSGCQKFGVMCIAFSLLGSDDGWCAVVLTGFGWLACQREEVVLEHQQALFGGVVG
ncbi:hypothetical protein AF72_03275 [Xylella taiwanensis]|uniref:Uncharacterized protein n=2 Tax=Xylella taiwanensis TaxID=1444770 RepID=Z9JM74_9GAMM|nr:hypothetical protein AB672_09595 [Xylella taiwanensis]EWS78936.1 hypothetical protein AF72_03275 [Xylella taiwanensis]